MASHRGKQKRNEKKRKQRQDKIRNRCPTPQQLKRRFREFLDRIDTKPFGPCFVSDTLHHATVPHPVHLIVTRELADARLFAHILVVDRACTGVMLADSTVYDNATQLQDLLEDRVDDMGRFDRVEPLVAQSIVFHALDFAGSLGFAPHAAFELSALSPRPEQLLDTPWAKPEKPMFLNELHGSGRKVRDKLDAVVGREGYQIVVSEDVQRLMAQLREQVAQESDDTDDEAEASEEDDSTPSG